MEEKRELERNWWRQEKERRRQERQKEEEIRKEEERRESTEREEAEFVKSVRETGGGVIGLVNKTNSPVTFTSLRLLMERSQVVDPYSRVKIDWAYKNAGIQSSTGFPDVTVRWLGNERLMCGGETLIVEQAALEMSIVEKDLESRWWKLEEEREKRRKDEIETHWQREGEPVTGKPKEKHTRWKESRREVQKDEKENQKRRNEAFVRSVRQSGGGIIGLINNTDRDVTFTSKRFLLPRCQVVKAGSHMAVDWAYKNGGLHSSTGLPDVTVHWDGWRRLLVAGETLTVDS